MKKALQIAPFPASRWEAAHQQFALEVVSREALLTRSPDPSIEILLAILPHKVDRAVLDLLPNLRLIANYGVGFDHIDCALAAERGIWVTNTPGILDNAVADLTWGLILAASRRMIESDQTLRREGFTGWLPDLHVGMELTGATLGLFGMGAIGRAVARRAHGFGMRVIYHNRRPAPDSAGAQYVDFETLLAQSDVLSLHAPLTEETRHRFNRATLLQMKPGSVLVNTARGQLVEEAALVDVLKSGHLMAAGLDVFEFEPEIHPELKTLPNAVICAHIGSATSDTRQRMGDCVLENVFAFLASGRPLHPVNQPAGVKA